MTSYICGIKLELVETPRTSILGRNTECNHQMRPTKIYTLSVKDKQDRQTEKNRICSTVKVGCGITGSSREITCQVLLKAKGIILQHGHIQRFRVGITCNHVA